MPVSVEQVSPVSQSLSEVQPVVSMQTPVLTVQVSPVEQSSSDVQGGVQVPDEQV